MKAKINKLFSLLIVGVLMTSAFTGCGNKGEVVTQTKSTDAKVTESVKEEIVLTVPHYKSGENVGAKFFLPQVERFNAEYAGQYKVVIEEVPQDMYGDKIKLLYQQNKLPALIEWGESGDKDFMKKVVIKNDMFLDLSSFIDSNSELKELLVDNSVKFNTTEEGKVVSLPLSVIRPIGMYYNKEMFEQTGITKSVSKMNVEEFEDTLAKLKENGNSPLALMTGENAWTTMLLATAIMANEEGGAEILKSGKISYDYTSAPWVNTFAKVQKYLQEYTTENALGAVYADAANNYLNERAALIANGPWMVSDFYDASKTTAGFDKKVGADIYPGGVAIAGTSFYGWWIPNTVSETEKEAALAFLLFVNKPEELEGFMVAEGGVAPNLKVSDDFVSKLDPILADLNKSVSEDLNITVDNMASVWPSQIGSDEFGKYLLKLVDGSYTPEEFAQKLTDKAEQFK